MERVGTLALALAALALYSLWLAYSPIYLHDTEVLFALHARAIARTLHDANGQFLPLYFNMPSIGANVWFQPMLVYLTAVFLKVLPLSAWSVRFPTVCVGVVDVVLLYFIGRRMFQSARYGAIAAILLALTPAHFIHSRIAMDYLYPVPFMLGWMLCLVRFEQTRERWLVFAGALTLGVGFYSYLAAVAMMPMYLAFMFVFLLHTYRRLDRSLALAAVGFALPLLVFLLWIPGHGDIFLGTISRYGVTKSGPLQSIRALFRFYSIVDHVSLYWNFYNPNYLFLTGALEVVDSTGRTGVFLLPLALLMLAGLYDIATKQRTRLGALVVAGFMTAPIAAVLVAESFAVYRELELLPFGVLLAVFGLRRLMQSPQRTWRAVAIVALILTPLQFGIFAKDYFTGYRLRSTMWFGGDFRSAVALVIERDRRSPVPAVYVSDAIGYSMDRYRYYLAENGGEALLARTASLGAHASVRDVPRGSLVLALVINGVPALDPEASAGLRRVATIVEPTGVASYAVLER